MERYVKTKKELKSAIKDEIDVIIVDKSLYNDLQPLVKIKKMPKSKISAIVGFVSTTGVIIIGSLAVSPATGGLAGAASLIGTMPAVVAFSATSGVSIFILVGILLLCISISVSEVLAIIKDYDVEEELDIEKMRFKRKFKKN